MAPGPFGHDTGERGGFGQLRGAPFWSVPCMTKDEAVDVVSCTKEHSFCWSMLALLVEYVVTLGRELPL